MAGSVGGFAHFMSIFMKLTIFLVENFISCTNTVDNKGFVLKKLTYFNLMFCSYMVKYIFVASLTKKRKLKCQTFHQK